MVAICIWSEETQPNEIEIGIEGFVRFIINNFKYQQKMLCIIKKLFLRHKTPAGIKIIHDLFLLKADYLCLYIHFESQIYI